MHHTDLIIAHLAFRDGARRRSEQEFYDAYGSDPLARPPLTRVPTAVRAALRRLR
jgi:hypothetical protein